MFKDYFSFVLKNHQRRIHYLVFCALLCALIFGFTFFSKIQTTIYEFGGWIFFLVLISAGTFSAERRSAVFLKRLDLSHSSIYWTNILAVVTSALEGAVYFICTKIIVSFVYCQLSGLKFSWENFAIYSKFIIFILPVVGIVITLDLLISKFVVSFIVNLILVGLITTAGVLIFPSTIIVNVALSLGGIILILFNAIPAVNSHYFKRINRYANYST
ncbi:hypothetical protein [Xylocopilactobacillus apicola]|uniref:hypothetical protein n=1 Tax=Xylocopilactobacillus apicola TaxID=2932184 RepID=UPI00295420D5|nr:hypothetical protein [Xylocopilactobacillus apicola]